MAAAAAAAAAAGEGLQATDLRGLLVPPPEAAADEFFYRLLVMRFLRPREMACLGAASKLSLQSMEVMAERILEAVLPVCYHSMAMPALVPVKPEGRLSFFVPAVYQATKKQVMLMASTFLGHNLPMGHFYFGRMIFESGAEGKDIVRFEERTETLQEMGYTSYVPCTSLIVVGPSLYSISHERDINSYNVLTHAVGRQASISTSKSKSKGFDDSYPSGAEIIEFQGKIYAIGGMKYKKAKKKAARKAKDDSSSSSVFCWEKQQTEGGAPTWSWVRQPSLNTARHLHQACVHDGKLFVAGGLSKDLDDFGDTPFCVETFDGTEWVEEEEILRPSDVIGLFSLPSGMHAIWTTDQHPEDDPDLEDEERWAQIQRRDDETGEWELLADLFDNNIVATFLMGTRIFYIGEGVWNYFDTATGCFAHDSLDDDQRRMPEPYRYGWTAMAISSVSFQEAMQAVVV